MNGAVRLQDVAEAAGVSIATASRSLSGAVGVSDAVAERVRQTARGMGYVVNVHARSLAGGATRSVGLVVHEIGDPYFSEIASGVLGLALEDGLNVQICHTGRDPEQELAQIRALIANQVGAIIIAGSGFVDAADQEEAKADLQAFRRAGGRVSVVGRHHLVADSVRPDNQGGATAVTEHLLGLGHRRLVVVSGSRRLTTVADRLAGVEDACVLAGVDFASVPVLEAPFTRDGGREAAERMLAEHPDATAVLALNDDMAVGVLSVLRRHGISVPEQISVSGFDDVAVAEDLAPSLTTVRLPMAEMGELALRMALKEPGSRPRRRTVASELVIRDSTAKPVGSR